MQIGAKSQERSGQEGGGPEQEDQDKPRSCASRVSITGTKEGVKRGGKLLGGERGWEGEGEEKN